MTEVYVYIYTCANCLFCCLFMVKKCKFNFLLLLLLFSFHYQNYAIATINNFPLSFYFSFSLALFLHFGLFVSVLRCVLSALVLCICLFNSDSKFRFFFLLIVCSLLSVAHASSTFVCTALRFVVIVFVSFH